MKGDIRSLDWNSMILGCKGLGPEPRGSEYIKCSTGAGEIHDFGYVDGP